MIGRNVSTWLEELATGTISSRVVAATHLLTMSEKYFDDKKTSPEERVSIINKLILSLETNSSPIVTKCVVYLAGSLGTWTDQVRYFLDRMLKDKSIELQTLAIRAVGNIGDKASDLIPTLISLASHQDREVRWRIPWALKEIGRTDNLLSTTLLTLARDKDSTTRMYALDAIPFCLNQNDSNVENLIKSSLEDREASVRGAACRVVGMVKGQWSGLRKKLEYLVQSDLHGVQLEAIQALIKQWPEIKQDPMINKWLLENKGYWWVEKLLNGK